MNHLLFTFASFNGLTGLLFGAGLACLGRTVKAEVIVMWRTFCAFAHRMHVKQTTLDAGAIDLLDRARPLIDTAMDEARAGLVSERATAAAVEADTVQNGSLMPKPVEIEVLPAAATTTTVATVATVAQTTVAAQ